MPDALAELKIADVLAFLAVRRAGSVTGAARALKVTPSQVSKAVVRLEGQLRLTLLARSARGVTITDAALRILPGLEDVVDRLRRLGHEPGKMRHLTVGAPSYLSAFFVPRLAERRPNIRLRSIEFPPALVRAYATDNFFDIALTLGKQPFPRSWIEAPVGFVRKALFVAPLVAARLGRTPVAPEKVSELPFVGPVYNVGGQFVPADDDCPLKMTDRIVGHEVTTVTLALELAARAGQAVFAPTIAATAYVEAKRLVEIPVRGWDVSEELFLVCNGDRVRSEDQKAILAAMQNALATC